MSQPTPRRNLERKVPCEDLAPVEAALGRLGARPGGILHQSDTYFRAASGRLKLRAIEGQPAVLIWYDRPDQAGDRFSSYYLVRVPDPVLLEAALAAALGVRGRVVKRRMVYHYHNVRIHLDQVEGMGRFVEFEAVLGPGEDEPTAQARLDFLGAELQLGAESVAGSYADLQGL